jgi:ABC-type transport system involved in multi-copper enzyme maturation permease subunit
LLSGLPLFGVITIWLTPFWLVTLGITLGMLVLAILYGLMWVVWRKGAAQIPGILKDGIMQPLCWIGLFLAGFTVVAAYQMPVRSLWDSAERIYSVGVTTFDLEVPPLQQNYEVDFSLRGEELQAYTVESDQDLIVGAEVDGEKRSGIIDIHGGEPQEWRKQEKGDLPFAGQVSKLFLTNYSKLPSQARFTFETGVEFPQVYAVPLTAFSVVGMVLLYVLISMAAPKMAVIASTTSRQAITQPIFYIVLALGFFALLANIYTPYNTFGEDVQMLKTCGMTFIMILAIVTALWTASVSVADEIEGRTALMLLSKPVSRRQFILGKFLGIIWPSLLLFVVLGLFFLLTISYKVIYDARESAALQPEWQLCYAEMVNVVPGLILAFMETVILASISVAISTRVPMMANLVICSTVYVLGHLVPVVVQSDAANFPIVRFVGRLLATIFPVLDYFNVQADLAGGNTAPLDYLAFALLYCVLYCTVAMLLALTLFEDRDLA